MKTALCSLTGAAVLLLSTLPSAHAAPVGELACTTYTGSSGSSPAQPVTGVQDTSVKVSYFSIGVTNSSATGSSSSGSGAGKVTFQAAEFHIALSRFSDFFNAAVAGGHFKLCSLVTTLSDGNAVRYDLKLVYVTSITAIASSRQFASQTPPAYADLFLEYGALLVDTTSGNDDGGTGPVLTSPPGAGATSN